MEKNFEDTDKAKEWYDGVTEKLSDSCSVKVLLERDVYFRLSGKGKKDTLLTIGSKLTSGSWDKEKNYILYGENAEEPELKKIKKMQSTYQLKVEEIGILNSISEQKGAGEKLKKLTAKLTYEEIRGILAYMLLIKIYRNQMSHAKAETEWEEEVKQFFEDYFDREKIMLTVETKEVNRILKKAIAFHREIAGRLEKE